MSLTFAELAQRQLLAEINEFTKQQLTDAEQKLVAVQKVNSPTRSASSFFAHDEEKQ